MPNTQLNTLKVLILTMLLFVSYGDLLSQTIVTGRVTDAITGESLIGASIVVKGNTNSGTITDFDGNFVLNLPSGTESILFSYTGYSPKEEVIGGRTVIDVAMNSGEILQDIVVVGYGTIKREDATGSLKTVGTDQFNKGAITGAQELLAGKIAGVSITPDSSPGGGATIRIRGNSSLQASNDPLIVIDGVPIDNGGADGARNPLNILNPNDIETFTVLKDASATAIYGSRASAGVILITTKKGKANKKLSVGFSSNVSNSVNSSRVDVLSSNEFREIVKTRYEADSKQVAMLGEANTDWQEEIYQNALGHDHNLSLDGGIGIIPYRVSLGYTNKNGVLKTDKFNRITTAINLTPGFFENTLQVRANFKSMVNRNQFADRGAIGSALGFDPTQPIFSGIDRFNGYTTYVTPTGVPNDQASKNPLALLNDREDISRVSRYITTFNVDYRLPFLKSVRANLNLAYDVSNGGGTVMIDTSSSLSYDPTTGGGFMSEYSSKNVNTLLETYLNYKESYGKNTVDVIGGYSWQHFAWNSEFESSDFNRTPTELRTGSSPEELYLVSLFGRVNYNFNEKLYASLVVRQDGSSRFSPETRFGLFPAASLAYKILDRNKKYLDYLKVRAGWGITGQQDIGGGLNLYAYQGTYETGLETVQYQFGDKFVTTIRPNGYAADIKWEETTTYNVGLDFSIIRNKLSGTLDVYQRLTKDLLGRVPVAAGTNLTNFITTNVGDMRNEGIELSLDYVAIQSKNIDWSIGANMAYNDNEITKLTATDDPDFIGTPTGGISGGVGSNIQIHSVGYSPNSFFVFEQLYDESGAILEGQFADLNNDGIVNADDKYRAGDPFPDFTYGITNNFRYKSIDFSFAGRASVGNEIYNNVETDQGYLDRLYNPAGNVLVNIHQSAIDKNVAAQSSLTFSDAFITDGSFFRLDHITLGWNTTKLIGKNFRLYGTVQNPFIITNYTGLDPEIFNGIDNNLYPRPTTYLVGLNVNF